MLPILKHTFTRRIFNTLLFELVLLNACFSALIYLRGIYWRDAVSYPTLTALFAISNTLGVQFSLWSFGLYSREVIYSGKRVYPNLIASFVFSSVILFPICYLFSLTGVPFFFISLKFYFIFLLGFTSLIALERMLILKLCVDRPYLGNILILGTGPATRSVIAEARRSHGDSFRLVGILSESPEEVGTEVDGCRVIGTLSEIDQVVVKERIGGILISIPIYSPFLPSDFLLRCKLQGMVVRDASEFYESLGKKILLEKLDPIQFLLSENLFMTRFRWAMKTTSEKLVAVIFLLLTAPVTLLTALLIKLSSRGPVFYRQERVGKDGKTFNVLKFRSMVVDAEKDGEAVWAAKKDPRTTRIGSVLRKFRIDELPQLLNVLRGEMSIIGPRPERPQFVDQLAERIPFYSHRHLVPPGISGWAQVAYPYTSTMEDAREKLRYDLYYIKHMSLMFDLMIILSTVRTVLFAKGSR